MTTNGSRTWTRALSRPRRALYISSPIGLGHAQRDVGIADALRRLHPGLEIDWLAQHPVTAVLEERASGVDALALGLEDVRHGALSEPIDLEIGDERAKLVRDRDVAPGVAEADG